MIQLTKRMATRLIKDSINVTGIAPGAFASEMNKAARDFGDAVGNGVPSGRIGRDEDMAAVAIYLAARSGDYVVGETIAVDGGVCTARPQKPSAPKIQAYKSKKAPVDMTGAFYFSDEGAL